MLTTGEIIARIGLAVVFGALLGLERNFAGKKAGMRTYAMVSLGSSLFVIISQLSVYYLYVQSTMHIPAAIITGIGFIGAGLILFQPDRQNKLTGLTSAAGLWVSAGLGMAAGFGFYMVATVAMLAALIIFTVFWFLEQKLTTFSYGGKKEEEKTEVRKM